LERFLNRIRNRAEPRLSTNEDKNMSKAPKGARRKSEKEKPDVLEGLPPLNLNAAGIDVGNAEHLVAVPPGRDVQPVQSFGSFTADVHRMGRWLKACRVYTVVMQATGVCRSCTPSGC
jgi:hypothetical protein